MNFKKKVLFLVLLLLLIIFLCRVALQIYVTNLQSFVIEPYELSDTEMISLTKKITNLTTTVERAFFLESMYAIDQKVRADETTAVEEYGYKSKEHTLAISRMDSVDVVNLYLTKEYLDQYGYPNHANYNDIAVYTPLLIFHHKSDFASYRQYFHYFYSAYKEGYLSAHRLSFSLNRKYMIKFGKQFQEEDQSYTDEEKIIKLIEVLELQ
ncbi:MAG: hypothetical protein AAFO69_03570 [Bacteroidota bacterium]